MAKRSYQRSRRSYASRVAEEARLICCELFEALRAEVTALQRELGALHMHAKQRDQYAVEKAAQALDWKGRAERLAEALRELHAKIDALLRDQEEGK